MARLIYAQGGFRAFWRGTSVWPVARTGAVLASLKPLRVRTQARVLYFTPSAAICWSTYEALKAILHLPEGGEPHM
jgi:hypothetical protein